jgi:hypothetical protein
VAQVCHPILTKKFLSAFDDRVWNLWLRILGDVGGEELGCCAQSLNRARMKAFLPSRLNGVGLRSWERASDFSWFSSVASCIGLSDPDFEFARRFIGKLGTDAYTLVLEAIGGPSYLERSKYELIPVDEAEVLSQSTFFKDLFVEEPKLKLQREFLELANEKAHQKFVNYLDHTNTSEKILIHSLQRPNVSILSSLFTADLAQVDVRLTKTEFNVVARQYVCLPPLKNGNGEVKEYKCGCELQRCANSKCQAHGERMDGLGNHGLICNPGVKAMRATLLEKALEKCFRRAGGVPVRQPSTYSLVGGHFTKDDLSRLFSGRLNKKQTAERKELAMKYLDIMKLPRGHIRTAQLGILRESFPDAVVRGEDDNNGMIRFDMNFLW